MPLTVAVVELHFCCGACAAPVNATLRLEGELEGPEGPFCVCQELKCPTCDRTSEVIFDTAGEVRLVTSYLTSVYAEPAWN